MLAWQVTETNTAPRLAHVVEPIPAEGEVVVRVEAVGLNFADMLTIEGKYQIRQPLPYVPGMEFSGVIERLGPNTSGVAVGDPVLATCTAGALAERITVPASRLNRIPDGMGFVEAAGFPIAYGTSHLALAHKARLRPGETLLVTGAAGGVGLTAVEIGKRLGARVIASARGADRLAVAKAAGADVLIDSDAPGLKEALRAEGGVDVVYDAVGGPAFDEALRATRPDGRLLAIGFASGQVPQVPANVLLVKNLTVIGFWYGGYETHAPGIVSDSMTELLRWRAEGLIRPHVNHALGFDALPEGLELLRTRKATGKVVIRVGQAP
ncbi:NADPH:quinone oxidoreductase family protein [Tabrizicola sp.]|uniref:NADPH:quinone oxidoreductase family protein n=1 Tax=Tabrizicola sp. TaxID=2005166 RepID=UPI003F40377F